MELIISRRVIGARHLTLSKGDLPLPKADPKHDPELEAVGVWQRWRGTSVPIGEASRQLGAKDVNRTPKRAPPRSRTQHAHFYLREAAGGSQRSHHPTWDGGRRWGQSFR